MQPTNTLGYLFQHVSSVLAKQSDQVLQERLGIGFSQFKILMALQWNPATSQRKIADALGQTEASVSRQIKLMHERELLRSSVSPTNRRQHITVPTTKGLKLTAAAMEALQSFHAPVFSVLNPKQHTQFLECLTMMHDKTCEGDAANACHNPLNNM